MESNNKSEQILFTSDVPMPVSVLPNDQSEKDKRGCKWTCWTENGTVYCGYKCTW